MPSNNQPFCVVDIHLLENAELLDMQEDEQMMAGLQAMGAVSELRFLQSLTGKKVVLPADWRAAAGRIRSSGERDYGKPGRANGRFF